MEVGFADPDKRSTWTIGDESDRAGCSWRKFKSDSASSAS